MEAENKYGIPHIAKVSRTLFYIGLLLGGIAVAAGSLLWVWHIDLRRVLPSCTLHSTLGLYCPGCGGTRACYALLQGRIMDSICAHPFVMYLAVGYTVYMLSHLLDIMTHGKIRGCYFCPYYWYLGIGIILFQFVGKNILLLFGFDLLSSMH